jgi:hypothetical protein
MKDNTLDMINHFAHETLLGIYGYRWYDNSSTSLNSVKDFMLSYNQLQLFFNYYENLHLIEDSSQKNGMTTYGIDIPIEYFRFPSMNNPFQEMDDKENDVLSNIVKNSKKILNYANDKSIVDELGARFEFLSLYSLFEGFCTSLLIEIDKDTSLQEEKIRKWAAFVQHNNLLKILKKIFENVESAIYERIVEIYENFEMMINLIYQLRNLYAHKNGVVTSWFIKNGLKEPAFLVREYFDTERQLDVYTVFCQQGGYYIYEGKNYNCQVINSYFRSISMIIVEIINNELME